MSSSGGANSSGEAAEGTPGPATERARGRLGTTVGRDSAASVPRRAATDLGSSTPHRAAIDSGHQQSSGAASESMCATKAKKQKQTKLAKHFYWNLSLLPVGFEDAYRDAVTSLRGVRREEQLRGAREEQRSLFNWKQKKKGLGAPSSSCWTHKFTCLDCTTSDRVPQQSFCWKRQDWGNHCSPEAFNQVLLSAYPKLRDVALQAPVKGPGAHWPTSVSSSPRLLKRRVGNGRIYIRPIQRDLSLEEEEACEEEGSQKG